MKKTLLFALCFMLAQSVHAFTLSNNTIEENKGVGTLIGAFLGSASSTIYTLENGTGSEDNAKFTISSNELRLNFTPDYENPTDVGDTANNNTYSVGVKAETESDKTLLDFSEYMNSGAHANQTYPNDGAFVFLKSDGSIQAFGAGNYGVTDAPTDSGYTKIYSNFGAFAALKSDGSIVAWGDSSYGGTGAPSGTGYTKIHSAIGAFAALKSDGSIVAWGIPSLGGTGAPSDAGYTKIHSNFGAFAALKSDGSIVAWGDSSYGGTGAPSDSGYTEIYANRYAFAALKSDGSVTVWGSAGAGVTDAPTDSGYTKIYSTDSSFAALKSDGSITVWGNPAYGVTGVPGGTGYTEIYSTEGAFAVIKNGSITAWGDSNYGGTGAPSDSGYTKIYSTESAFAALKSDGSIVAWGRSYAGGTGAPSDSGYTKIYSTESAFAALKSDGSITSWGNAGTGGTGAPGDSGYTEIYSNRYAFAALKSDGSITSWGNPTFGGASAPADSGYTAPYGSGTQETRQNFIITVTDADETDPTATFSYSETNPTNQDVTVTMTTSEEIVTPTGWTKASSTQYTKSISINETTSLNIEDLSGNSTAVSYVVANIDKELPTITLNGVNPQTVPGGSQYVDAGATCADNNSCVVTSTGAVDTSTAGSYTVTYTAEDPASNTAIIERTVLVEKKSSAGRSHYVCRDPKASNYQRFGRNDDRLCRYSDTSQQEKKVGDKQQNLPSGSAESNIDTRVADLLKQVQVSQQPEIASTSEQIVCPAHLQETISLGRKNNPDEVNKLINFLNGHMAIDLAVDGSYDQDDFEAVKQFQTRYASSVLEVWGLKQATGYVHTTTRMKINALRCQKVQRCPVFKEYNSRTQNNNSPEVRSTKIFLTELGFYQGGIDSLYDDGLFGAMKKFQETFSQTMLKPWGLTKGTGYKYKTTNKFMNEMVGCSTQNLSLENGVAVSY